MTNNIMNIVATGIWQTVTQAMGFPRDTTAISMQMREDQINLQYRWYNNAAGVYFTVKAGTIRTVTGKFQPGELQVLAAVGNTIEIEVSTQLTI